VAYLYDHQLLKMKTFCIISTQTAKRLGAKNPCESLPVGSLEDGTPIYDHPYALHDRLYVIRPGEPPQILDISTQVSLTGLGRAKLIK
jgi:hypothetical protein